MKYKEGDKVLVKTYKGSDPFFAEVINVPFCEQVILGKESGFTYGGTDGDLFSTNSVCLELIINRSILINMKNPYPILNCPLINKIFNEKGVSYRILLSSEATYKAIKKTRLSRKLYPNAEEKDGYLLI